MVGGLSLLLAVDYFTGNLMNNCISTEINNAGWFLHRQAMRALDNDTDERNGHDIARTIRLAQLAALERIMDGYARYNDKIWNRDSSYPTKFQEAMAAFCRNRRKEAQTDPGLLLREAHEILQASTDGILAPSMAGSSSRRYSDAIGELAVEAVLDELREDLHSVMPDDFPDYLKNGAREGDYPSFLVAFADEVREAIRSKPRYRDIMVASGLAEIKAQGFEISEILLGLEKRYEIDSSNLRNMLDQIENPGPIIPKPRLGAGGPRRRPISIKYPHPTGLLAATFSPSGRQIVTAIKSGVTRKDALGRESNIGSRAYIWNIETPQSTDKKTEIANHESNVVYASFSHDESLLVTASEDGTAAIWYCDIKQKVISRPLQHGDTVTTASFSPNGERIVTSSLDGTAVVWNANTGASLRTLNHRSSIKDDNVVNSACFSPQGEHILTAAYYGGARIWDAQTGAALKRFDGKHRALCCAAYSSDGDRIVMSDAENGTASVWDVVTEAPIALLDGGHKRNTVWSAAFANREDWVVTAGEDTLAVVWDVKTQKVVHQLAHSGSVITAYFSPDDKTILTACDDGYAYLWDIGSCS